MDKITLAPIRSSAVVSPEAEDYARAQGLHASLVATREAIERVMQTAVREVAIELSYDPEEHGPPVLRFTMLTTEAPDRLGQRDEELHDALFESVPPDHRQVIALVYRFPVL